MSSVSDTQTPYFGLRDFLLYFVPGFIVFLSVTVLVMAIWPAAVSLSGNTKGFDFTLALVAVITAYFLGHAFYPINLFVRHLAKRYVAKDACELEGRITCDMECFGFAEQAIAVIEKRAGVYMAETSRYTNLARFCSAMVFPSLLLSIGLAVWVGKTLQPPFEWARWPLRIAIVAFGGGGAVWGFMSRYRRYAERYIVWTMLCEKCPNFRINRFIPSSWTPEATGPVRQP